MGSVQRQTHDHNNILPHYYYNAPRVHRDAGQGICSAWRIRLNGHVSVLIAVPCPRDLGWLASGKAALAYLPPPAPFVFSDTQSKALQQQHNRQRARREPRGSSHCCKPCHTGGGGQQRHPPAYTDTLTIPHHTRKLYLCKLYRLGSALAGLPGLFIVGRTTA